MGLVYRDDAPNFKFHIAVYMLVVTVTIFYLLAAVGYVSNSAGIPNIFNFTFRDPQMRPTQASKQSTFELRIGYFGVCAGVVPELACIASSGSTPEQVIKRISVNVNAGEYQSPFHQSASVAVACPLYGTAKSLLKIALDNQSKTMPFVLLTAGILFLLGLLLVLLLQFETKKVQRKTNSARKITIFKRLMLCLVWTSTALAFGAAFSTTQLSKIIQRTNASSVSVVTQSLIIEPGAGLQVIQWLAASFSFFFSVGVSSIFMVTGDNQTTTTKSSLGTSDIDDF
ncbi:MAG: hypothetical protein Q9169_006397 [Polycauliona sp. 2 TL-2023]